MAKIPHSICDPIGRGAAVDPAVDDLHPEAQTMFHEANSAYRADTARQFERICIYSGKRLTRHQTELYRKHLLNKEYGIGNGRPANNPGYSLHEYGVAVDVVRGNDEPRIVTALSNSGWTQHTNAKERHHFEATDLPSWSAVENMRTGILEEFKDPVKSSIRQHIELSIARDNTREAEREQYRVVIESKRLVERLDRDSDRLRDRRSDIKDELSDLKLERRYTREECDALQDQLDDMSYQACPNGYPYDECTHNRRKRRYRRERRRLRRAISDKERELHSLDRRIRELRGNLSRLDEQIDEVETEKKRAKDQLSSDSADLRNLRRRLAQLRRRTSRKWLDVTRFAQRIQDRIDEFLRTA